MKTSSQAIIKQIKETKRKQKITYDEILQAMSENGVPAVSLTTLRRVCANDSEAKASTFNYEETLLPIADALKRIGGDDAANEEDALRDILKVISEQIDEKDRMIKRLIDRLDQKDEIIHQFLADLKEKDETIRILVDKCLS